jgi:predicted site-specific integrase-resolvase
MKYLNISEAAFMLGLSTKTLRRWEKLEKFIPEFRTLGNHRRYSINQIKILINPDYKIKNKKNIIYSRVSSNGQKKDLARQEQYLINYCKKKKIENIKCIKDLGSGINFKKRGLKNLLNLIINYEVDTIFLTYKDRLLRMGYELIVSICEEFNTKIVVVNKVDETFNETLVKDLLEITTVFSSRLYGSRGKKKKTT